MSQEKKTITRRQFIKRTGAIAALIGIGAFLTGRFTAPANAVTPVVTTLNGNELDTDILRANAFMGVTGNAAITYDTQGRVSTITYGDITTTITYDTQGRIATASSVSTALAKTVTATPSYSANGNISGVTYS